MTKINFRLLAISIIFIIPTISFGVTFTAVQDGDWNSAATWGAFSVPGIGDDVVIDGFEVEISSNNVTINNLLITNNSGTSKSLLEIRGNHTLNVQGDFTVKAENQAQDVKVMIYGSSVVNVDGDMLMERSADNQQSNTLQLLMYESGKLLIDGAFDYLYRNSNGEAGFDIQVYDTAEFSAGQPSTLQQSGGDFFFALFYGSATVSFADSLDLVMTGGQTLNVSVSDNLNLTVGDDLSISNSGGTNYVSLAANTGADISVTNDIRIHSMNTDKIALLDVAGAGSTIDIGGNLRLDAVSDNSAKVSVGNDGTIRLAGNLERPNEFGALAMQSTGSFYFDGGDPQIIPRNKYDAIVDDSLVFTQVFFENTSTGGLTLDGNFTVTSDLTLTSGVVHTTADSLFIIDDGVSVSSANDKSYIDGPVIKRGTHSGTSFIFPIGNNGIYAPIEIDAITAVNIEYTAEFTGCPPPVGVVVNPLKLVNQQGFWEMSRNDANPVGDVSLHWSDADALGLTDTASIVAAYYDGAGSYYSLGDGPVSGGIGAGVSGAIKNDTGCPPPVGANLFVIGSMDEIENALPVELVNFQAYSSRDQSKIFLNWETASEVNSDYFVIEKSYDGIIFFPIDQVAAAGNSSITRRYTAVDLTPNKGNNYFRIQEVDLERLMSFSNLVNVFINDDGDVPAIYPNPVVDMVKVYSKPLKNKPVVVKVLNVKGQCIYTGQHNAQDGQLFIPTNQMNIRNPGIYFLNYQQDGEMVSLKFLSIK